MNLHGLPMNESKTPSVITDKGRNYIPDLFISIISYTRIAVPCQKPRITLETSGRQLKACTKLLGCDKRVH